MDQKVGDKQTDDGKNGCDEQIENSQKRTVLERDRLRLLAPSTPNLGGTFDTCSCDIRAHSPPIIEEGTIRDKSSIFGAGGEPPRTGGVCENDNTKSEGAGRIGAQRRGGSVGDFEGFRWGRGNWARGGRGEGARMPSHAPR